MVDSTKLTPKKRLTEKTVLEQIVAKYGNVSAVASAFGVNRSAVYDYIAKRPKLQQALADARELMLDEAETALRTAVQMREGWAVCFLLKTLGRSRGYIEKQETEQSGTLEIIVRREKRNGTTETD